MRRRGRVTLRCKGAIPVVSSYGAPASRPPATGKKANLRTRSTALRRHQYTCCPTFGHHQHHHHQQTIHQELLAKTLDREVVGRASANVQRRQFRASSPRNLQDVIDHCRRVVPRQLVDAVVPVRIRSDRRSSEVLRNGLFPTPKSARAYRFVWGVVWAEAENRQVLRASSLLGASGDIWLQVKQQLASSENKPQCKHAPFSRERKNHIGVSTPKATLEPRCRPCEVKKGRVGDTI